MAYDYVQGALPQDPASTSVAGIPGDADLNGRSEKLVQSGTTMQLARLTPQERAELGGPSSVEEQDLNQTYADFADAAPELMAALGCEPSAMRDTVNMEQALGQAQGATEQVKELSGTGAVLLAAELTSEIDDVTEAVARIRKDGTEAQQKQVQTMAYAVEQIRAETVQQAQARQGRKKLRQSRQDAALSQSSARQELMQKTQALQGAELPDATGATGATGHKAAGQKAAKGHTQGHAKKAAGGTKAKAPGKKPGKVKVKKSKKPAPGAGTAS